MNKCWRGIGLNLVIGVAVSVITWLLGPLFPWKSPFEKEKITTMNLEITQYGCVSGSVERLVNVFQAGDFVGSPDDLSRIIICDNRKIEGLSKTLDEVLVRAFPGCFTRQSQVEKDQIFLRKDTEAVCSLNYSYDRGPMVWTRQSTTASYICMGEISRKFPASRQTTFSEEPLPCSDEIKEKIGIKK